AFLQDWITFAQELEQRHGLVPRTHDWDRIRSAHFLDQDENGSRYTLLDGVHLIWKRCHSWGNVIGEHTALPETFGSDRPQPPPASPTLAPQSQPAGAAGFTPAAEAGGPGGAALPPPASIRDTYCPAPYDQFVVQWNGDVVSCCTDYE